MFPAIGCDSEILLAFASMQMLCHANIGTRELLGDRFPTWHEDVHSRWLQSISLRKILDIHFKSYETLHLLNHFHVLMWTALAFILLMTLVKNLPEAKYIPPNRSCDRLAIAVIGPAVWITPSMIFVHTVIFLAAAVFSRYSWLISGAVTH